MRIAVTIDDYRQCGPDDYEKVCHIKEVYESTTIGELVEWQKSIFPWFKDLQNGKTLTQMRIQNME